MTIPDTVRIADLPDLGLTLDQVRSYPAAVEYSDADGPYWLGTDIEASFGIGGAA